MRWFKEYVEVTNKPSEQRAKRNGFRKHILPALGKLRLDNISIDSIELLKRKLLKKKLSPKTVNNLLSMTRRCLGIAVEWNVIAASPRVRLLRAPPPGFRYLHHSEVEALLDATRPERWHLMILLAVRTGLRFSELVGLEWSDINFERREIHVQRANVRGAIGSPKNNRTRRVFMSSDLSRNLESSCRCSGLVFTQNGHAVSEATAWRALRRACVRAGMKPIGWHVLRHTFATELVRRGASVQAIKELLGHSSLQMTLRYAHVSEAMLRETIALLEEAKGTARQQLGSRDADASSNTSTLSESNTSFSAVQTQEPIPFGTGS